MKNIIAIFLILFIIKTNLLSQNSTEIISISAVGDVMLSGSAGEFLEKYGYQYPFLHTKEILKSTDLAICNLEGPFVNSGTPFEKTYTFKVPPKYAPALIDGGFDLVSIANNHIMDYGEEGLFSTMRVLDSLGIKYAGAGKNSIEARKPAVIKIKSKKVAFLAYSTTFPEEFYAKKDKSGTNFPFEENLINDVRNCDKNYDIVIVSFHWGAELMEQPKHYQKALAHISIDNGADLVLGHHPHVLQSFEIYKSKLIAYSLGNFSFGSYSEKAKESVILIVELSKDKFSGGKVIPISVHNVVDLFQPKLLSGDRFDKVVEKINEISVEFFPEKNVILKDGSINF
jgi:poly-gamma-glutamate synthesis protein (capsule biosynthesis protein)